MTWLKIWSPAAAGVVAAIVVWAAGGSREVQVVTTTPAVLAGFGVLVSLGAFAVHRVRTGIGKAYGRGYDEAYRDAQADRRRFVLRLDHELKNPLTAMHAGLANLRLTQAEEQAEDRRALDSVDAQASRLGRLLADLRKLSELENRAIEHAPVDLAEVLADVEAAVSEQTGAADRTISVTLPQAPWPLPRVAGDRDLLFVAFHNLATNAVKYSRPGDRIEIRAAEEGPQVLVEVADTGLGIPADEVAHVWEELARGRAARGIQGTGLGLSLVRAIVNRHQGRVTLRSRDGQGTVVAVRLPVAQP